MKFKWVFDAIFYYGFKRPIRLFVKHYMCACFYVGCRLLFIV
jgi:hypothetical protein